MGAARMLTTTLAGTAIGVALLGAPAYAGGTQETEHGSFDPAGDEFTCGSTVLAVTGGVVDQVMHMGLDHDGVFHFTGTLTVHGITARDLDGDDYTITGASWFGGKGTEGEQQVFTETDHFVIRAADGGVYGRVQVVDHYTVGRGEFRIDVGGCEAPAD